MTLSEIFLKAADLIERNGKATGCFASYDGVGRRIIDANEKFAFCADGAIRWVCGVRESPSPINRPEACRVLAEFLGRSLFEWNDGLPKEKVVSEMRRAAKHFRDA